MPYFTALFSSLKASNISTLLATVKAALFTTISPSDLPTFKTTVVFTLFTAFPSTY